MRYLIAEYNLFCRMAGMQPTSAGYTQWVKVCESLERANWTPTNPDPFDPHLIFKMQMGYSVVSPTRSLLVGNCIA